MNRRTESHIFMRVIGLTSILLFFWTAIPCAEEMPVPMEMQFPLFLKILTFDRNLRERAGNEIVIGIVYQSRFRKSLEIKDALVKVIRRSSIKKVEEIPVRCVAIDMDRANLRTAISRSKVNILYIAPLRAELLRDSVNFVLSGSSVRCEFFISDDLWTVEVDEGQISQVINNMAQIITSDLYWKFYRGMVHD